MLSSSTLVYLESNLTLPVMSNISLVNPLPMNTSCSVALEYLFLERLTYLYLMSPLCLIGLLLNVINLLVFADRSFKNLTFKYLRLIAFVDCITCILVFIYCITNYTRPRTLNDKYFRTWYLVNVYFPMANITAGCNVLLTITVTIERLISVRWPMSKQRLFSPRRIFITLLICFLFPILANSVNFLVYKVGQCNNLDVKKIATTKEYKYFGICKEILLRFIPICILICSNCLLLSTVHAANRKFKPEKIKKTTLPPLSNTGSSSHSANGCETKSVTTNPTKKYIAESQSQTDALLTEERTEGSHSPNPLTPISSTNKMHLRKQQQEKQLTVMLVWISTLYLCGQIPMLFAYPNFVFKDTSKASYKYYALVVNLLELVAYLANFFIYVKFTTQYQQVFRTKLNQFFSCSSATTTTTTATTTR